MTQSSISSEFQQFFRRSKPGIFQLLTKRKLLYGFHIGLRLFSTRPLPGKSVTSVLRNPFNRHRFSLSLSPITNPVNLSVKMSCHQRNVKYFRNPSAFLAHFCRVSSGRGNEQTNKQSTKDISFLMHFHTLAGEKGFAIVCLLSYELYLPLANKLKFLNFKDCCQISNFVLANFNRFYCLLRCLLLLAAISGFFWNYAFLVFLFLSPLDRSSIVLFIACSDLGLVHSLYYWPFVE